MERLKRFIQSRLGEPLHLNDLAEVAALSPYYFCRWLKERTGMAPKRYLLECRIEAAKDLLCQTTMAHSEIAYACGFASASHFSTSFKMVEGMTPAEYRRSITMERIADG